MFSAEFFIKMFQQKALILSLRGRGQTCEIFGGKCALSPSSLHHLTQQKLLTPQMQYPPPQDVPNVPLVKWI